MYISPLLTRKDDTWMFLQTQFIFFFTTAITRKVLQHTGTHMMGDSHCRPKVFQLSHNLFTMTCTSNLEGFLSHNASYVAEFERKNYSNLPAVPNKLYAMCGISSFSSLFNGS